VYNGLGDVKKEGKWGFIDILGNVIHPFIYSTVTDFQSNIAFFCDSNKKWGILDSKGIIVSSPKYDKIVGLKIIDRTKEKAKSYFDEMVDKMLYNHVISAPKYDNDVGSNMGFYQVEIDSKKNGPKWGMIDDKGFEVIPPIYCELNFFGNGLALVRKDCKGNYGYIDKNGKLMFPFIFDEAKAFEKHFTTVAWKEKGGMCLLSSNGKYLVECSKKALVVNDKIIENCSCCEKTYFSPASGFSAYLYNIEVHDKVKKVDNLKDYLFSKDGVLIEKK